MKTDEFGNRMKRYESVFTSAKVDSKDWMCVRIDGKKFSKFTNGFTKPFDQRITGSMVETTKALVKETHASFGYTQSDEITLLYPPTETDRIFGSKVSKVNSVLASIATVHFNKAISNFTDKAAYFDCRVWGVPTDVEASNVLLWRVQDARKNSISALFRWTAGHKAMNNLNQIQMKDYLEENCNVVWADLPDRWKYGTYVKPVVHETILSDEEWAKIPKDKATDRNMTVTRKKIEEIEIGYFGDLDLDSRIKILN